MAESYDPPEYDNILRAHDIQFDIVIRSIDIININK